MDHPDKSDPNPLYLEFNFNDLPNFQHHHQQQLDVSHAVSELPYNAAAQFYQHFDAAQYMEAGAQANPEDAAQQQCGDDQQQQQQQQQYVYHPYGSYTIDMLEAAEQGVAGVCGGEQLQQQQQQFEHEFKHESFPPPPLMSMPAAADVPDDRIVVAQPRLIKQPVIVRTTPFVAPESVATVAVAAVERRTIGCQTRGFRRKEPHCRLRSAGADDSVFRWCGAEEEVIMEPRPVAAAAAALAAGGGQSVEWTPVRPSKRLIAKFSGTPPKSKKCLLDAMQSPEKTTD